MFQRNILRVENMGRISLHAVGMRCAEQINSHNPFLWNGIKYTNDIYPRCTPMGCRLPESLY